MSKESVRRAASRRFSRLDLGTINCFGSPGSGEEEDCSALLLFVVAVSGITRLRKSDIATIRVFRLISASRIL